jgi:hypothetical protein
VGKVENAVETAVDTFMRVPLILVIGFFLSAANAGAGEVSGPYAKQLSQSDVAQIKAVVSKQPGMPHNVRKIEAVRPDQVAIQTGGKSGLDSATYYDFKVYKRAGKWAIDVASIEISTEITPNHRLDSDATGR